MRPLACLILDERSKESSSEVPIPHMASKTYQLKSKGNRGDWIKKVKERRSHKLTAEPIRRRVGTGHWTGRYRDQSPCPTNAMQCGRSPWRGVWQVYHRFYSPDVQKKIERHFWKAWRGGHGHFNIEDPVLEGKIFKSLTPAGVSCPPHSSKRRAPHAYAWYHRDHGSSYLNATTMW